MVVQGQQPKLTLPMIVPEDVGDPRAYAKLAEAVGKAVFAPNSAIGPVPAGRMLKGIGWVCQTLTGRSLDEANNEDENPVESLRRHMEESKEMIGQISASYLQVDKHWKTVEDRFGDKAPKIPKFDNFVPGPVRGVGRRFQQATQYLEGVIHVLNDMLSGTISSLNAERKFALAEEACLTLTGQELQDVAERWTSPLRRFRGPLETPPAELVELRQAYHRLEEVGAREAKEWDALIGEVLILQHQARHDPAKFMVYVFRDADPSRAGQVLDLEWFHVSWMGVWLDAEKPNSLIMAPPRHGKSFCICAFDLWEVGNHPHLRFLVLYDKGGDKVAKEILRIKGIMKSPTYRAVFPEIRVLGRKEGEKDTQTAFTVGRKNQYFSREATFEGAGILGNINGDGFDRIRADDFSPPQCREEPYQRQRIARRFVNVVEERLRDPLDARIRVIHTPWHPEDAVGLIRRDVAHGRLPLWRTQIDPYAIRNDARGQAVPLWARKANRAFLEEKKWRLGPDYACNYGLEAADAAQKALHGVMYYNSTGKNQTENDKKLATALTGCHRTLSIDPAASDARTASDTGVIDAFLTDNGFGFVQNCWMHHLAPVAMLEWVVSQIIRAWQDESMPYDEVLIEAQGAITGMVTTWEDWIPKELTRRGMTENAQPRILTPGTRVGQGMAGQNRGKFKRLKAAAPYLERGCVRLAGRRVINALSGRPRLEAIPGSTIARLVGMMLEFDGTTRFDAGDALSQWVLSHKSDFQDPFAQAVRMPTTARPQQSEMQAALAKELAEMKTPKREPKTLGDDMGYVFGKFRGSQQRNSA